MAAPLAPPLMMGHRPKAHDVFQPRSLGITHVKRTSFDENETVRARVRFRMGHKGHPTAWLDDLHSMNALMKGRGDQRSAWTLPMGAPYEHGAAKHRHVGGLKIARIGDEFVVDFYGPRPIQCEPERFKGYVTVPVSNVKAFELHGEGSGAFETIARNLLPLLLLTLMNGDLAAQTKQDLDVHAQWAAEPVPVRVFVSAS